MFNTVENGWTRENVLQGTHLKNQLWENDDKNVHTAFEEKSWFFTKADCTKISEKRCATIWLNNNTELCSAAA